MEKPFVSIVIPAFNSGSTLGQTIEACIGQDYPRDKLEVIVVDDGSIDDTKGVVENFGVSYIYQESSGPAFARNNGWKNSKGKVIFFTDADCIPLKGCLAAMIKSLYDRDVAAVAGTYGIKNEKYITARCIHAEIMFRHLHMPDYVNSFGTYNVLIKKSILEEFSGFNEDYLTSSAEDSEFSYRMVKKGYKIYFERKSIVSHFHEKNFSKYLKKQFTRSFWAIKLWRHHPGFALNDYYLHWKDLAEIPVAVMIILTLPLLFLDLIRMSFIVLLIAYTALQIIIPLKIYSKKFYGMEFQNIPTTENRLKVIAKRFSCMRDFFFMFFMMFARGFTRVSGGALSLIKNRSIK